MISKEDIYYRLIENENLTLQEIIKQNVDNIIIWLSCSVKSNLNYGMYYCMLEYNGKFLYYEGKVLKGTPNQTLINGAIEGIRQIKKPVRVCLVSATRLGFEGGFKMKGPNASLIQVLLDEIAKKNCELTEIRFKNGAEKIKSYIRSKRPVKNDDHSPLDSIHDQKEKDRKEYLSKFKEKIWIECLEKVTAVLLENDISDDIIAQVKELESK